MSQVFGILQRKANFLLPICQLLEEHIYRPLAAGQHPTLGLITELADKPLFRKIADAVEAKEVPCSEPDRLVRRSRRNYALGN